MPFYAVKYTRTQVVNLLVEADSEEEAKDVNEPEFYLKIKAQGEESNSVAINKVDTVDWSDS